MNDKHLWLTAQDKVVHPHAPNGGGGPGKFRSAMPSGRGPAATESVSHPFSPEGRQKPLSAQQERSLKAKEETGPPAKPDEEPTFIDLESKNTINADSLEDFIQKANSAMNEGDAVGHLEPEFSEEYEVDEKTGRLKNVKVTLKSKIVRPVFGTGRVRTDAERDLINKAVEIIKNHEEKHRDIAKKYAKAYLKALQRGTEKNKEAIFKKIETQMDAEQAAFDAREGQLYIDYNGPNGKAGPPSDVHLGPLTTPMKTK
ncbi:MAG: DUF922 domain-containing protein [Gemmataceae bacterium]